MKITRSEFLIESTAAVSCAVIAPDLYRLTLDHLNNTNPPLLVPRRKVIKTLIARLSEMDDEYVFDVAGVPDEPPPITWRDYFTRVVGLDPDKSCARRLKSAAGGDRKPRHFSTGAHTHSQLEPSTDADAVRFLSTTTLQLKLP